MGTTSEKLTYLNDTKQLLKENINNLGGSLINEPFRQYASVLEGIYERIPKVSGIGTNLSLSPTMVGKIKLNEIQGNTLQENTPTPDTPVEIESVTGLQNIEVCGKNLFDKNNANNLLNNVSINANTGIVSAANGFYTLKIPCKPNTTYTVSKVVSSRFTVAYSNNLTYTSGEALLGKIINNSATNITITTGENAKSLYVFYSKLGDETTYTLQQIIDSIQIEENLTQTTYEPYTGTTYEVNLGKNLFDISTTPFIKRVAYNSSGVQVDWNNYSGTTTKIKVQPNTTYTLSEDRNAYTTQIIEYNSGGTFITRQLLSNYGKTFTTGNNTYLINISISDETIPTQVQLEKGSTATAYSPYFTPIELNKIGDYQDSIKKSTGKNLWGGFEYINNEYVGITFTYNNNGTIIINGTNNTGTNAYSMTTSNSTPYQKTLSAGTYTISGGLSNVILQIINSSGSLVAQTTSSALSTTFTINQETKIYIRVYVANGVSFNNQTIYIMLEENSSPTEYEPYLPKGTWYVEKQIGKVVLDGSKTYTSGSTNTSGVYRIRTTAIANLIKTPSSAGVNGDALSNYFGITTANQNYQCVQGFGVETSGALVFYDSGGNTQTTSAFTTWLSTHNTEVNYVLNTPTYTEITNTELINQLESIKSQDGTTNISITSENLPMILNVSALKGDVE